MWTIKDSLYFFLMFFSLVICFVVTIKAIWKKGREIDKGEAMHIISEAGREDNKEV